jgi:hypothetical protein
MHLTSCVVCEDPVDVDIACLNFSAAQAAVLNYTLFVNLPEFLRVTEKRPREETASRSIISDIVCAPTMSSKASKREPQQQQETKARILNTGAVQSLMVDADKFKALQKYQKFCPKEHGTDICIKYHFRGFCYEGCPRIHNGQESGTAQAIEAFHAEALKQSPNFA